MIIFIPWIIIVFILLAIVGTISQALDVNLMPIMTFISIASIAVSIYMTATTEDDEKKTKAALMIFISVILFFISISTSCTTGDMISCLWYGC